MISRLCQYLAGKLVICLKASEDIQDNGNKYDEAGEVTIAESDDRDVYAYGIEIFISLVSNSLVVAGAGIITGKLGEMALFFLLFAILRQYTGGYHASTHLTCNIVLFINVILNHFAIEIWQRYIVNKEMAIGIVGVFSILVICLLAPDESPNKPIPKENRGKLKRDSIILGIMIIAAAFVLRENDKIATPLLLCNLSVAIALLADAVKKRKQNLLFPKNLT